MRSRFAAALRHPASAIGVALTTASGFVFLILLSIQALGFLENPYIGILVYVLVPALFLLGLLLIPVGLRLERRRTRAGIAAPAWPRIDLNDPVQRSTLLFVAALTLANVAILSVASYGAVEYSESQQFCGQACHAVMEPEFTAHQSGPHARVHCVACHVGPGPGGFVAAKLNGTRQLWLASTGTFSRPIPTPLESMPDVRMSCEQCHWPDRFVGDRVKVIYEHADDEANTQTMTTVRLHVGGPVTGTGSGTGIHWHMNRGNEIEYVALDEKREQIPYVRVTTPDRRVREYFAEGVSPADLAGKARRRMDCLDCHNRPAHRFGSSPERAVDAAIGEGRINAKIPFIRRDAVRALMTPYASHEVAVTEIERTLRDAANARLPHAFEEADLREAIGVTQAIYRSNVFPSMKVGWGTYPNQIGHTVSTGCFRCHDENHKTTDGVAISQDCELCHSFE
ncbi:MAG: NapC/NirT family cytochrome c [Vicinamibacterales bacterium]